MTAIPDKTAADAQQIIAELERRLDERTSERDEALERQTATADILKIIASSPSDVRPVFEAIATSAKRLIGGFSTTVFSIVDDVYHLSALTPTSPAADAALKARFPAPLSAQPWAEQIRNGEIVNVADIETESAVQANLRDVWRMRGFRALLLVPLRRDRASIGMISLTRKEPGTFAAHHVQLLQTFADQAAIAIENARLFNETKEALERQTATAEILKVIASSPNDVQPVFEAIAESAKHLMGGQSGIVTRVVGDQIQLVAFTKRSEAGDRELQSSYPIALTSPLIQSTVARTGEYIVRTDIEAEPSSTVKELAQSRGYRSTITVPMLREGISIGTIGVARHEAGPFTKSQIDLLKTFADQAVIAIENARLFNEVQAKTRDLTESLQHQTATADVLKVISRSVFDLQTVLDTLVESAYRLCGANLGLLYLKDDEAFECKAIAGLGVEEASRYFKGRPIRAGRATSAERVIMTGEVQSVTDFFADTEFDPNAKEIIRNAGNSGLGALRSTLGVPMMRDRAVIGVLVIASPHTGPFPQRQIDLLQTFADQAVIAIENARLFDEVQAKTRDLMESLQQQTATADVLQVISRSAFDLNPVFETVAESSVKLCGSERALIFRFDGELLRACAAFNAPHHLMEWLERNPVRPGRHSVAARAALERRTIHVRDVRADQEHTYGAKDVEPFRTVLGVPMLKGNDLRGVILVYHNEVRPFTEKQIALVETFADQAVIAIENVRLFDQVQARTLELSQSLEDLKSAQDRLVQTEKLASLGQLTAGIAHEIKNPLNFVNNFSGVSTELIDELREALERVETDDKTRSEITELADMLRDNLAKIVQHGQRADSIVKNMLLHSREGSGERRSVDLNAIVEDSLNLAYHGARAEKQEFTIKLERSFDPAAGEADLFPQEITRVLLNLISNGVYAAMKRKAEMILDGYEPTLTAGTKNLGDNVEIRIRDNGGGIPPEVREKIFNPFFTTKPPGQGTGLGLSLSYDIIVKQHSGSIEVDTQPGEFSEFRVILPRKAASAKLE